MLQAICMNLIWVLGIFGATIGLLLEAIILIVVLKLVIGR